MSFSSDIEDVEEILQHLLVINFVVWDLVGFLGKTHEGDDDLLDEGLLVELMRLPVTIDDDILSGTPVFQDTRVPVEALITNLEAGLTLDAFLENFPSVTREQALQILEFSKSTLLKLAHRSWPFFLTNRFPV